MIDYDKLKIAHELADKYALMHEKRCELILDTVMGSINNSYCITFSYDINDSQVGKYYDIDNLIIKLRELTQSEPKYKIGEKVWTTSKDDLEPVELSIESIKYSTITNTFNYSFLNSFNSRGEDELYPTKAALIDSQIEYWCSLIERAPSEMLHDHHLPQEDEYCNVSGVKLGKREKCDHVSDETGIALLCHPPIYQLKCKKCGEFYK